MNKIEKDCCTLSAVAYTDMPFTETFTFLRRVDVGSDVIYAWRKENKLYLAIRGTDELRDWMSNIFVKKCIWDKEIKIHSGFFIAFTRMSGELSHLIHYYGDVDQIYCTGHSRGGALAEIAALFFFKNNVKSITFGAPRIGNKQYLEKIKENGNSVSFALKGDIITKLPFLYPKTNSILLKGAKLFSHNMKHYFF